MEEPLDRDHALGQLEGILDRAADGLTEEDVECAIGLLEHPDANVRLRAADLMPVFAAEWTPAPILLDRLAREPDPAVKAQIVDALASIDAYSASVLGGLDEQEDDEEAVTPTYHDETVATFRRLAADESEDPTVRAAAVVGLGELSEDPEAGEAILPYLDAEEPAILAAALHAVGFTRDAEGIEGKIRGRLDHPDPRVRRAAIITTGLTQPPGGLERIRELLDSPDPATRGAAWIAFADAAPLEEADLLIERLGNEIQSEQDPLFEDFETAKEAVEDRCEAAEFEGMEEDDLWDDEDDDEEEEAPAAVPGIPYRRETPKVGRNDPCPCGSGKKYKKCCLK
ncbi:MAG: HEAT repeat domain-containing protein [Armatimonadetes bacterium]|nr:HEAT repeat domain-containing protein [Armatimonadota bacterium]